MAMECKRCCLKCGFHFFNEDECPNCAAKRFEEEYKAEWNRQLKLLELATGIRSNDDFWKGWHSKNDEMKNRFRNICRDLAPLIYDWYTSIENERGWEQVRIAGTQTELFEEELPF